LICVATLLDEIDSREDRNYLMNFRDGEILPIPKAQ